MLNTDLKVYLPKTVSAVATTNGGRMSSSLVTSGVVQNVWPHVPRAERTAGSTKWRKLFCKVADDSDGTLVAPQYWLDDVTEGDDYFVMQAATQDDVEDDIGATDRKYGVARLYSDATISTSTIVVDLEHADLGSGNDMIIKDGDTIRITDMADPTAVTGNEQFMTVNGTPSLSGTQLTITTTETLDYGFATADDARVSSVYEPGDCECSVNTPTVTSSAGTFDESVMTFDNIGTVYQEVTLTFTDATNFTVTSDDGDITLASGSTGVEYAPSNADFTKPYFTIPITAFGGTFAGSDTIVFTTTPAAFSVWERRIVPAAADSQANNKITLVTAGEAA